jgi:MFS family permease
MYGHKTLYSVGVLALSLFSALIAAIPTSFPIFCLIRGLQGMAAACTVPTTYAIISTSYQGKAKQLAVAGIGFCLVMGGVLGSIRMLTKESYSSSLNIWFHI